MIIPVVSADIDPATIEVLITSCVDYHRLRGQAPQQDDGDAGAGQPDRTGDVLALLEHQILAAVLQVVSGPGGVASFLRRLVALRDQTCRHPADTSSKHTLPGGMGAI
jgi:hypothetical protein